MNRFRVGFRFQLQLQLQLQLVLISVLISIPSLVQNVAGQATLCLPDTTCRDHRIDAFGSLAAYDLAIRVLYNASGCSEACIGQCECVCNTTGIVFDELTQEPRPPYCLASVVCQNKVIQHTMNYDAEGYNCEKVTVIALSSVYQLCASVDNECGNGTCDAAWCSDSSTPIGEQVTGVPSSVQVAMGIYVVAGFILFVLAMSVSAYYRYDGSTDDDDDDDDVDDATSPLLQRQPGTPPLREQGPRYRRSAARTMVQPTTTLVSDDSFAAVHM